MNGLNVLMLMIMVPFGAAAMYFEKRCADLAIAVSISGGVVIGMLMIVTFIAWAIHVGPLDGVPL